MLIISRFSASFVFTAQERPRGFTFAPKETISSFGINLDEEQDKLSSDINNLIIDISNMLYTLVSYKHEYENYDSIHRDRNKSKNMVPSLEEEYTLDDEYKLTLK